MKTILDTIIDQKRKEVQILKAKFKYTDFEQTAFFNRECISFSNSIRKSEFALITEIKRKSPSAGIINDQLDPKTLGLAYFESGATAISCLTDNFFFGGLNSDLETLRESVPIPILRKDFIIDEFQIFEAKAIGADAILLIAEALTKEEALHLTIIAQSLGLEVLMECHDRKNSEKLNDLIDVIGVNNRNLHLQKTTLETSYELIDYLPKSKLKISESGIKTYDEIRKLSSLGYHGALIGESILSNSNPGDFIHSLKLKKNNYVY